MYLRLSQRIRFRAWPLPWRPFAHRPIDILRAGRRILIRATFSLACAAALAVAVLPGNARAQASPDPKSTARVYLFTGFMGVGSRLDPVIARVKKSGLPLTVSGPAGWSSSATEAIADYKKGRLRSIAIVGYSLGGGSALSMAAELDRANVPVRLIVTVDPVGVSAVTPNVRRIINYYVPSGLGAQVSPAKNFHGSLQNIAATDPNLNHYTLARSVERLVFKEVMSAAASKPTQAADDALVRGTKASATQAH